MENTFVFSDAAGYDMVVAVTEKTINDQIATLASPDVGIIKTESDPLVVSTESPR